MIEPATASRSPSATARSAESRRSDGADAFQQSLAAFLDTGDDDADAPPVAEQAGNDDPAADGNPLPDQPPTPPTLAWLAQLAPVPATGTVPVATPTAVATPAAIAAPLVGAVPLAPVPLPVAPANIAADLAAVAVTTIDPPSPAADPPVPDTPPQPRQSEQPQPNAFALPVAPEALARTAAPAAEVFGAAIRAAAGKDEDATPRRGMADATVLPVATAALEPQRHAVLATGDVQQAPLDTRQGSFPHQMIDRIEQLRDSANANDTRIRLVPDALGTIDVTMRRDGDTVHVHFDAQQSATRTMLADAQPQLAGIADARGLKLGQTSVGTGDGGAQQQQQRPAPAWQPPRAPAPAEAATPITDDIRIA